MFVDAPITTTLPERMDSSKYKTTKLYHKECSQSVFAVVGLARMYASSPPYLSLSTLKLTCRRITRTFPYEDKRHLDHMKSAIGIAWADVCHLYRNYGIVPHQILPLSLPLALSYPSSTPSPTSLLIHSYR